MENDKIIGDSLTYDDVLIVPDYSDIKSRSECNTSVKLFPELELKVPIISSPMSSVSEVQMCVALSNLGAIGCLHRFMSIEEQVRQVKLFMHETSSLGMKTESTDYGYGMGSCTMTNVTNYGDIIVAIGCTKDYFERFQELYNSHLKIRYFCIDTANGDSKNAIDALIRIKEHKSDIRVMVGNVATQSGTLRLINAGADSVRVGIGGGSSCTTRIKTGAGVPNLTSILDCVDGTKYSKQDVSIVADGGIKNSADFCKSIAAGAQVSMLGSLLSATRECPVTIEKLGEFPNEQLFVRYYGEASIEAKNRRGEPLNNVEGTSTLLPYKGHASRIVEGLLDGLRSSMSYVGARTISEFHEYSRFIKITSSSYRESLPHILGK